MTIVQRLFGIKDDPNAGGTPYDKLTGGVVPDSNLFWPITGGTVDKGVERVDRNDEARGRRAASPTLPFKARPVMTIPVPAYRTVLEKQAKKTLGGEDAVTGSAPNAVTHSIKSIDYPASSLPAVYSQLVRDDLNHKMSGAVINRFTWNFPLDGEGTTEVELAGLYMKHFNEAIPTAGFEGLPDDIMMLRDAQIYTISGAVNEVQKLKTEGVPAGGSFTLTFDGQTTKSIVWNAAAAAVQTALLELSNLDTGDVVASGGPLPTEVVLTFGGAYAGRDVPIIVPDGTLLTGGTTPKAVVTGTTAGSSTAIVDLQGFELTFNNNVNAKPYARKNVVTEVLGTPAQTKKLWFPQENRISAAQDVTYAINLGNVSVADELAHDFSQVMKFVFEVFGGPLATTEPKATELLRVTIYAGEHTGGGADALSSREDITSRFEGSAFYSKTDADDIKVEIVNDSATPIT